MKPMPALWWPHAQGAIIAHDPIAARSLPPWPGFLKPSVGERCAINRVFSGPRRLLIRRFAGVTVDRTLTVS